MSVLYLGAQREPMLVLHQRQGGTILTTSTGQSVASFEYHRFRSDVVLHTDAGPVATITSRWSSPKSIRSLGGPDLAVIEVERSGLSRAAHRCRVLVVAASTTAPAGALLAGVPAFNTAARRRRTQGHI